MPIEVPQFFRVADLAEALGVTEKAIRWMAYSGELPKALKINGRLCWTETQVQQYLDAKLAEAEQSNNEGARA